MKRHSKLQAVYRQGGDDGGWGVRMLNVGVSTVPPYSDYPAKGHPNSYLYGWQEGRILKEFQIILLTRGAGVLETRSGGVARVERGDGFMLFPGEWHRFRPDVEVGWTSYCCGFDGPYAQQVIYSFFSVEEPVLRGVATTEIIDKMNNVIRTFSADRFQTDSRIAAAWMDLLTTLVSVSGKDRIVRKDVADIQVSKLRTYLDEHITDKLDLQSLAARFGIGYSQFRKRFRRLTGSPPLAYVNERRLMRACQLLRSGGRSIGQIAGESGFESQSYFSRFFFAKTGQTPGAFVRSVSKR